jgi:hypothetical protein
MLHVTGLGRRTSTGNHRLTSAFNLIGGGARTALGNGECTLQRRLRRRKPTAALVQPRLLAERPYIAMWWRRCWPRGRDGVVKLLEDEGHRNSCACRVADFRRRQSRWLENLTEGDVDRKRENYLLHEGFSKLGASLMVVLVWFAQEIGPYLLGENSSSSHQLAIWY